MSALKHFGCNSGRRLLRWMPWTCALFGYVNTSWPFRHTANFVGCEDWKWKILSSVLLLPHLQDSLHLTNIIKTHRGKTSYKQKPPSWSNKMNIPLANLVKPVMIVSRQHALPGEQTSLWSTTHKSTQLNCPSTRGHTISFMLFPLKPHPNFFVLPWLPSSRIFVEQLKKGCLALKYIFLSLFVSPVTQEGSLLVTVTPLPI